MALSSLLLLPEELRGFYFRYLRLSAADRLGVEKVDVSILRWRTMLGKAGAWSIKAILTLDMGLLLEVTRDKGKSPAKDEPTVEGYTPDDGLRGIPTRLRAVCPYRICHKIMDARLLKVPADVCSTSYDRPRRMVRCLACKNVFCLDCGLPEHDHPCDSPELRHNLVLFYKGVYKSMKEEETEAEEQERANQVRERARRKRKQIERSLGSTFA